MVSAGTGDTTGKDLRAVRSELPKAGGVLVIDRACFLSAENTYFSSLMDNSSLSRSFRFIFAVSHFEYPPLYQLNGRSSSRLSGMFIKPSSADACSGAGAPPEDAGADPAGAAAGIPDGFPEYPPA